MFLGQILGFWLLVGLAFFGLRHLSHHKEFRAPRVIPPSNGHRR
jgi:hypothetical protein